MPTWREYLFLGVGAVIAAVVIAVAMTPTHPERHGLIYDECLAAGHSTMACDAMMRVRKAEAIRTECIAKNQNPDDPFGMRLCLMGVQLEHRAVAPQ